jgi:repressor LexA
MYGPISFERSDPSGASVGNSKEPRRRGRKPATAPTPAQDRALSAIRRFAVRHGFPPTVKELGEELGIAPASAHELITALERKGCLHRSAGKARSLEILPNPAPPVEGLTAVPIVGRVPAGSPVLAIENVVGELLVDSRIARGRCFALKVKGDSMIDADINDGDYVIVRQQPLAESGEIVVAMLANDATVKRLRMAGEVIELRPENRRLPPILIGPDDDLRILGRVVAVHRRNRGSTFSK